MNILVLNGSPKPKSDTMRLTRSFLEGMTRQASCSVTIVDVIHKDIRPCRGCFACWKNGDGRCVQQDDQNEILAAYQKADLIIWSFPLYCYSMPSHLKAVLDRTIPLIQLRMKETDGRVQHEPLIDFSEKRTIVICGSGFPDWDGNFEGLRLQCKNSFGQAEMVFVPETPLMNVPEAEPLAQPLLTRFFLAGQEYAKSLSLSPETIHELQIPMMPKEDYIRAVNASAPHA
ncbi:MAG: flavodoxin family protein [Clostridia bacterium]|nr:flavodoxin family protein [Clostridia bacterium]